MPNKQQELSFVMSHTIDLSSPHSKKTQSMPCKTPLQLKNTPQPIQVETKHHLKGSQTRNEEDEEHKDDSLDEKVFSKPTLKSNQSLPVLGYKELYSNYKLNDAILSDKTSFEIDLGLPPFYPSIQNHVSKLSEIRKPSNKKWYFKSVGAKEKEDCDISNLDDMSGFRVGFKGLLHEELKLRALQGIATHRNKYGPLLSDTSKLFRTWSVLQRGVMFQTEPPFTPLQIPSKPSRLEKTNPILCT